MYHKHIGSKQKHTEIVKLTDIFRSYRVSSEPTTTMEENDATERDDENDGEEGQAVVVVISRERNGEAVRQFDQPDIDYDVHKGFAWLCSPNFFFFWNKDIYFGS